MHRSEPRHCKISVKVAIEGEDAICNGESVQLNASGTANEFRWSTGQEGMSIHPVITKTENKS